MRDSKKCNRPLQNVSSVNITDNMLVQLALDEALTLACKLSLAGTPTQALLAWVLLLYKKYGIRPHCTVLQRQPVATRAHFSPKKAQIQSRIYKISQNFKKTFYTVNFTHLEGI